jgi:hypothetical protein
MEQRVNVAKILAHEDYDSGTISNDICLLKVTIGDCRVNAGAQRKSDEKLDENH